MSAYAAMFEDETEAPAKQANIVAPKKSTMFGNNPQLQPTQEPAIDELDQMMLGSIERNKKKVKEEPGLLEKAVGVGEAGLGALTGLISVPLSGVVGIGANLASGKFGTQAGIREAEKAAAQTQQALTYQPSTPVGQDYAQQLQSAFEASKAPPILPEAQSLLSQRAKPNVFPKVRMETMGKPVMSGLQNAGAAATDLGTAVKAELATAPEHLKQVYSGVSENNLSAHDLQYIKTHKLFNKFNDTPTEGQALQDPRIMSEEYNAQNKAGNEALHQKFAERDQKVINAIEETKQKITPEVFETTPQAAANLALEKMVSNDNVRLEDISQKYQKFADSNGGELPVAGKSIVELAAKNLEEIGRDEFVPNEIKNILKKIEDLDSIPYKKYEQYRTILSTAQRSTKDGNVKAAIGAIRDAFESIPMEEGTAEQKVLADDARAAYKARKDLIESNPAYKTAVEGDIRTAEEKAANVPHPAASNFIDKHYSEKTSQVNLNRLLEEIGKDTPEHQGLNSALLDKMKSQAGIRDNKGKPSQATINKFVYDPVKGYASNLPTMLGPENLKELQDIADYARMTDHTAIPGSYANVSKSGMVVNAGPIGQAFEKAGSLAASALEQGVNLKSGFPAGTLARSFLKGRAEEKAAAALKAEQEIKLRQTLNPKPPSKLSDLGTINIKGNP
jgi:hypothetical protein